MLACCIIFRRCIGYWNENEPFDIPFCRIMHDHSHVTHCVLGFVIVPASSCPSCRIHALRSANLGLWNRYTPIYIYIHFSCSWMRCVSMDECTVECGLFLWAVTAPQSYSQTHTIHTYIRNHSISCCLSHRKIGNWYDQREFERHGVPGRRTKLFFRLWDTIENGACVNITCLLLWIHKLYVCRW